MAIAALRARADGCEIVVNQGSGNGGAPLLSGAAPRYWWGGRAIFVTGISVRPAGPKSGREDQVEGSRDVILVDPTVTVRIDAAARRPSLKRSCDFNWQVGCGHPPIAVAVARNSRRIR